MTAASTSDRLTAVLRAAQYLSNLSPEQDPWAELAQAMKSFFANDILLVVAPGPAGEPRIVRSLLSHPISDADILRGALDEIRAVLGTGFLGSVLLSDPPCSLAVLPLPRDRRTAEVAVVGRVGQEPFSKEELEILLALGSLFRNVVSRLETEMQLRDHRHSLEDLVSERRPSSQRPPAI